MRVILTRHYQTQSNAEGRILGWGNSPPYHDWKDNVDFIDTRLHENGINFDAIYSSDLERARKTAKIYAGHSAISDIIGIPELNEINYGKLQAKKKSWVSGHYPQHKKDPDLVYPDGESFRQMQQRSVQFLSSLAVAHPQHTVLIVSHAGVIRGIVSYFLGLEYASAALNTAYHSAISGISCLTGITVCAMTNSASLPDLCVTAPSRYPFPGQVLIPDHVLVKTGHNEFGLY